MKAPSDMFAQRLLEWFDHSGRHDLPWQHPREPYRVWVSEIMLQQTQVRTAIPYFERFVAAFPTLPRLAAAPLDDVLAQWSGLGYYARARNLHAAAKRCVDLHDGGLPRDLAALVALPGVGRSTAAAILAQAWGERFPILDGNVKRVLARYHGIGGWPNQPAVEKQLWALAEQHLPAARMADYTQAQMDFGATLCTRQNPACALCVLQESCVARLEGRVEELPTPRPGKILPERSATVILAENGDGEVLLQRRPPIGIWASLWSLPEAADSGAARVWFDRHLHGDYAQAQPLKAVRHAFSHYRLQLHPLHCKDVAERALVRDNDDLRWVARPALVKLGLPAPIRKLLSFVRTEMTRTVFCEHTRQQAEGLDFVPYPGPLGQRIYAHIGKPGWAAWLSHQTMLINENRLSPRDPAHRAFLERELEKFLFEGSADRPAGYVPEG